MPLLKADVKVGESLQLSGTGNAIIRVISKTGQRVRLDIMAAETMEILVPQKQLANHFANVDCTSKTK